MPWKFCYRVCGIIYSCKGIQIGSNMSNSRAYLGLPPLSNKQLIGTVFPQSWALLPVPACNIPLSACVINSASVCHPPALFCLPRMLWMLWGPVPPVGLPRSTAQHEEAQSTYWLGSPGGGECCGGLRGCRPGREEEDRDPLAGSARPGARAAGDEVRADLQKWCHHRVFSGDLFR